MTFFTVFIFKASDIFVKNCHFLGKMTTKVVINSVDKPNIL